MPTVKTAMTINEAFARLDEKGTSPVQTDRKGVAIRFIINTIASGSTSRNAYTDSLITWVKDNPRDPAIHLVLPEMADKGHSVEFERVAYNFLHVDHPDPVIMAQAGEILGGMDNDDQWLQQWLQYIMDKPDFKAGRIMKKATNGIYEGDPDKIIGQVDNVNLLLIQEKEERLAEDVGDDIEIVGSLKQMLALNNQQDILRLHDTSSWMSNYFIVNYPSDIDAVIARSNMDRLLQDHGRSVITTVIENIKAGVYNFGARQDAEKFEANLSHAIYRFGVDGVRPNDPLVETLKSIPADIKSEHFGGIDVSRRLIMSLVNGMRDGHSHPDVFEQAEGLEDDMYGARMDDEALNRIFSNPQRFMDRIKKMISDSSNPQVQLRAIQRGLPLVYKNYSQQERAQLWDSLPRGGQIEMLKSVGSNFSQNALQALVNSGDREMSEIAKSFLQPMQPRRMPPAPAKPQPDVEAAGNRRTVVAAVHIEDMADALRKLKSPVPAIAYDAAEFITTVRGQRDEQEALRAYLFSPRYNENVGHLIMKRARQVFGDAYADIAAQILYANHPDPYLCLQAAGLVGMSFRDLPSDLAKNPEIRAARYLRDVAQNPDGATVFKGRPLMHELQRIIQDPKETAVVEAFKDFLFMPKEDDVLGSGTLYQSERPSMLVGELLRHRPGPHDPEDVLNYMNKSGLGPDFIMYGLVDGMGKLPEKATTKEYWTNVYKLFRQMAKHFFPGDNFNFLIKIPAHAAIEFIEAMQETYGDQFDSDAWIEKINLAHANDNEKMQIYKNNPSKYQTEIKTLLWKEGPDRARAIRELLPFVYGSMDQGTKASFWEQSDMNSKLAILETVGSRWSTNALAALAGGNDAIAGHAAKLLAERQQSHLIPRHQRDPEL